METNIDENVLITGSFFRKALKVARKAMPVARVIAKAISPVPIPFLTTGFTSNNNSSFIGPIQITPAGGYKNSEDRPVALYISTVNEAGVVSTSGANESFPNLRFSGGETLRKEDVEDFCNTYKAGDIFWTFTDPDPEDGILRFFMDLKKWNGNKITIFDFDNDPTNNLGIEIRHKSGDPTHLNRLIIENTSDKYTYEFDVTLIDASGDATNIDILLNHTQTSNSELLDPEFTNALPIERAFVKVKCKEVQES